ncbi:PREDICTED: uncharacterized protein LOC109348284 isoform X1 [Lupinus angustifolius]|uniref:uncharacterized protein LOC109348284 isoform X1 n=1 Tax=Lupinus angustifolius TaxID=3871 RepID=UPI00092F108F|nr:PREDICTED: uncharacterized protein LOC109348284 isoform X1 [Lupinus angustifolius]
MVVKMMRWRPLVSTKYEVRLIVKSLINGSDLFICNGSKLTVEIKWKGPKLTFGSLRRNAVARNFTKEAEFVDGDGGAAKVVKWDEEFRHVCNLNAYKDNAFQPWEIVFTVFNELNHRPKNKVVVVGTALLNIGELASQADQKDFDLNIPLKLPSGSVEPAPSLCILISLVELRAAQESMNQRSVVPMQSPPAQSVETTLAEKDDLSAIKAGLKKVKILTNYVSSRRVKKGSREGDGSEGKGSRSGEDGEYDHPLDSDSLDDFEEGDPDEGKEDSSVRKPLNYGSLAYANAGSAFCCNTRVNCDDEDWVYYSNRRSDVGCSQMDDSTMSSCEPYSLQNSKRNLLLSWRKRKMRFRSPKANKGEPLLKKAYAEEGGDDIDFDRRQLSSDDSLSMRLYRTGDNSTANRSPISEFGDDNFAVGSWEQKEVMSRDGHMKLQTQVFFAAIDQRSERAAGESACTALVAVIADWFQNNRNLMPIKSQFDSLIREGSSEWRNLCDNETYKERFPDKHFDLETVIQAKIRPLSVVPRKSVIGFFHPEGMDEERFDFLHGAMSFDNIWDEISHAEHECSSNGEPRVYIVSWNDHFFILKVELDAYYIIDTLGERLYEGCNQAYILKFDNDTVIKMQDVQSSDDKTTTEQQTVASVLERDDRQVASVLERNDKQMQQIPGNEVNSVIEPEEQLKRAEKDEVVCRGKEACKEYIKSFLAAIPIRELQADVKKGLISSTPLHHRLQIEFNYTQLSEASMAVQESLALAVTETTPVAEASMVASETLALAVVTEASS